MSDDGWKTTSFWLVLLVLGMLLLCGIVMGGFVPIMTCPNCNGKGMTQAPLPRPFGRERPEGWRDVTCRCCDGRRRITAYQRYRYNQFHYLVYSDD